MPAKCVDLLASLGMTRACQFQATGLGGFGTTTLLETTILLGTTILMKPTTRIGFGWDSHEFVSGVPLKIGGVSIAHNKGLGGHSDGDVLLHAITDALLGAIGAPDIGTLFPPSDPQWKGADSAVFLNEALKRLRAAGYVIGNVDSSSDPAFAEDRAAGGFDSRARSEAVGRRRWIASGSRQRHPRASAPIMLR